MISLTSKLEHFEDHFSAIRDRLQDFQFALGGNWDYDHGYFDRALDEEQKVWLRIPFRTTKGSIDSEADEVDALIRLERPFILKHLYREGSDPEAALPNSGGLMDQFQEPADKDAEVEERWVEKGQKVLAEVEQAFLQ